MMRRFVLALLALAAGAALAGQHDRPIPDSSVAPYREAKWSEVFLCLRDLPRPARDVIRETLGATLAERGALWNGGCVIDGVLPTRRFVLAATTRDQILLVYEHGGFVSHQHAVCFTRGDDGGFLAGANVEVHGISKVAHIPEALAVGRYGPVAHY